MKTSITKSRAGHYSVTMRGDFGTRFAPKLNSLDKARRVVAALKADPNADLDVPVYTSVY
jgi:phage tail sheath gpL-like